MRKLRVLLGLCGIITIASLYQTYTYIDSQRLRLMKTSHHVMRLIIKGIQVDEPVNVEHFRGLKEENRLEKLCVDINRTIPSETIPPFYPYEGIGKPAVVSDDEFDTSHFRHYCSSNLSAIVIVYSAAQNFERRKAIRYTIGQQCEVHNCKLLFIGGISKDKAIADMVKVEYAEKQDIFMKNKIDTYVDLNNKAVAMLDWLLEFCQQPKYVIHLIDDAFVNINLYLQGLSKIADSQRYVYGQIFSNQGPHRDNSSIYYVSPESYPIDWYPDFIVGISYAFPNSLTRELRCAVHKAKYVWLEDVWLLGEIKEYLGFKLIQSEYESWHPGFETIDIKNVSRYLYLHNVDANAFHLLQQLSYI